MKRIMWLCNCILSGFEEEFGVKKSNAGGWMNGLLENFFQNQEYSIILCFPIKDKKRVKDSSVGTIDYYSFYVGEGDLDEADIINNADDLITRVKPDLVHIWGTEFMHSYAMSKVCKNRGIKTIVDIQGITIANANACLKGIPQSDIEYEPRKGTSIREVWESKAKNAITEQLCINNTDYVVGRTLWDRIYSKQINHDLKYFCLERCLRKQYYEEPRRWSYKKCVKHTIFVSQSNRPYKGLHFLLEALEYIIKEVPDVVVKVAGGNQWLESNLSGYGAYINSIIYNKNLSKHVEFIGNKAPEEMIEEYLSANLYVLPSVAENNSNSTCEAQFLGTPVISSFVGGMGDIVENGKTGLFYSYDDVRMLAGLVCNIIDDEERLNEMSKLEQQTASKRHEKNRIMTGLLNAYSTVLTTN